MAIEEKSAAQLQEQLIEYRDGDAVLEGFLCYDPSRTGPLPAVIIAHAWAGRDEFVERKARRLAWHGYAAFALDMYGKGKLGTNPQENRALQAPFVADRALLARRVNAALHTVKNLPGVDSKRIAAMGYCFGGTCVLDLARSGAEVRGVVSLHGTLTPSGLPAADISSKVLILHGYEDPLAKPEAVLAAAKEFTDAGVDWQVHAYGHVVHSFTNPQARDAGHNFYNLDADRRSWHALMSFFDEVLR